MSAIYLSGSSTEHEQVALYARELEAAGYRIAHPWWEHVAAARAAGKTDAELADAERLRVAQDDLEGVLLADTIWLLVPAGAMSFGAGVELGFALKRDMLVVVSGEWRRSIFTALAEKMFDAHDEALAWLVSRRQRVLRLAGGGAP